MAIVFVRRWKKSIYLDKEKVQTEMSKQQTNPADVTYLALDDAAKVWKDFCNSKWKRENFCRVHGEWLAPGEW